MGYLNTRSKPFLVALALAGMLGLGAIDYVTGPELAFSIFYLLPVTLAAWFVGRRAGIAMAAIGAATWLLADLLAGHVYSNPAIPYWNTAVRFGFFLIITYMLSGLRLAQERQEEMSQFIVHDLRSPLGSVMTGLQTLQEIADERQDSTQNELIEICLISCQRMLTLITSLLDVARLEHGQMPAQASEVDVGELVESSIKQVSIWAGRNQVSLSCELAAGAGTVYTDQELTRRILVNLLSNAIKFSRPGSVVTVRAARPGDDMVAFSVVDRGRGIPKEWAERVFDKFAQVKSQKTGGPAPGSGLGLTFCRLAVEALGGRIWLESEVGKGTTVTFTLPGSGGATRPKIGRTEGGETPPLQL